MHDLANELGRLRDEVADLRVERARLRDALRAIVDADDATCGKGPMEVGKALDARDALIDAARALLARGP
jgi:hypothetical protein